MNIMFRYLAIIFLFILSTISSSNSLEKIKITDEEQRIKKLNQLSWYNYDNPEEKFITYEKANSEFYVLDNEIYLKNTDVNQYCWWQFGKPCNEDFLIIGDYYTIYMSYVDDGYVKIDDWKNVDTNEWLKELRENAAKNAEIFKKQNLNYATNVNWIFKPEFNDEKKLVNYSKEILWNDEVKTMEATSIVLGKKGYINIDFVYNIKEGDDLKSYSNIGKDFAEAVYFNDGFKHTDFKEGDKVAAVGIGGLVAGTLGVKALAKAGAFAKFIPLLAKFWWILLAPIAALGLFRKKTKPKKRAD